MAGLTEGLLSVGVDVIDLGVVATPMVYFGTNITIQGQQAKSGIMITGSHNPPDYNGLKFVREGARPISADTGLREMAALIGTAKKLTKCWSTTSSAKATKIARMWPLVVTSPIWTLTWNS